MSGRQVLKKLNVSDSRAYKEKDGLPPIYNVGKIRNYAVSLCRSEFLYLTELDILLHDRNYLKNLVEANSLYPFAHPRMRRLNTASIPDFIKDYEAGETIDYRVNTEACFVDYSDGVLVIDEKEVIKEDKHAFIQENRKVVSTPKRNYLAFHAGGYFLSKKLFQTIGGYSEEYFNVEDAAIRQPPSMEEFDFFNRLKDYGEVIKLDETVLHFEHDLYDTSSNRCGDNLKLLKLKLSQKEK